MREVLVAVESLITTQEEIEKRIASAIEISIKNKGQLDFLLSFYRDFTILNILPNTKQGIFFAEVSTARQLEGNQTDLIIGSDPKIFFFTPVDVVNALLDHINNHYPDITGIPINIFLSLQDFFQLRPTISISSSGKLLKKEYV